MGLFDGVQLPYRRASQGHDQKAASARMRGCFMSYRIVSVRYCTSRPCSLLVRRVSLL